MILSAEQLTNGKQTLDEIQEKRTVLNTAVDVQVILHILIDKGICTAEEINVYRNKTKALPKFKSSYDYIGQAIKELQQYVDDPQSVLREMMNEKLNGKR